MEDRKAEEMQEKGAEVLKKFARFFRDQELSAGDCFVAWRLNYKGWRKVRLKQDAADKDNT